MAVNPLSYTGTAELGIGGTTVPVTPTNPNLDIINNSIRDVLLLDNQRNIQLFQNKVRDRDRLNEMIVNNQVSSGDILPEYRKHFDDAEKQAEKAFLSWGGNYNDKEGFRKYNAALQDLKDISAHAQAKTLNMRQLEKEKAQQVLPRKQQEYGFWIEREKQKPFWEQVTPYQQLHDFSVDDILAGVKTFSREAQDPNNPNDPAFKVTESYVDFDDILRFKRNQYVNDQDAADSIDQVFDKLQRLAPHQLVPTLDAMDAQIDRYNQERGLSPGERGYVDKVGRVNVNGQTLIQDPKPEFAAKYALANQGQFVSRTPKFNKDLAGYGLDKQKLALQARKLGIDAAKAGAYIRNLDAKTKKFLEQEQAAGTNVAKQFEDFVNAMEPRGLPIGIKGQSPTEVLDIIYTDRLPQSYQFINGPVVSLDAKGKPTNKITVGRLEPFITTTGQRRPYYIPRYVNSQTGDPLTRDSDFIKDRYKAWRQGGYNGTLDDMVKTLIKTGAIELTLQGRNGAANYSSLYQSAKTLNALGTTKGEENIVNAPEEIPEEPLNEE
jgi:hypothetical protein